MREFGLALEEQLAVLGFPASFDSRTHLLSLWNALVRVRLIWRSAGDLWRLRKGGAKGFASHILLVRMRDYYQAQDFFLVSAGDLPTTFPNWLSLQLTQELRRYWCATPEELVARLARFGDPTSE